jgi:hypothetical protein
MKEKTQFLQEEYQAQALETETFPSIRRRNEWVAEGYPRKQIMHQSKI